MSTKTLESDPFITYLEDLKRLDNRGALAALRRGLGQPPYAEPEVSRVVQRALNADTPVYRERACYIIAPLFAWNPLSTSSGNLGTHLRGIRESDDETAIERRFTFLLNAHPDDLADYLRQAVGLLKAKEKPLNWNQLLLDVMFWLDTSRPDRRERVQTEWSRDFWRKPAKNQPVEATQTTPEGE